MRLPSLVASVSTVLTLGLAAVLPACGGGGDQFRLGAQSIKITSNALPAMNTGSTVNVVIPIDDQCGGPYVMSIISGALPPGMFLDNATHSIKGVALQQGNFHFDIQIDATGCQPFATTHEHFDWSIGIGPVTIVACDPAIIPQASYNPPNTIKYNDIDGLASTVYNAFAVFNFTVAGGNGPYTLETIDDPADPDDTVPGIGSLPTGVSIPPFSTSLVGAPQYVKPGGIPFRITFKATDSNGQTGTRKLQWKIDTPPIIIATTTLLNGKCGSVYSDSIQVAGGVPPFELELTGALCADTANPALVTWQSPAAPLIYTSAAHTIQINVSAATGRSTPSGAGYPAGGSTALAGKVSASNYPGLALAGPYTGVPPEGVWLVESTGALTGIPRRLGTFTFNVHVFSTLVPNEFGQHGFKSYSPNFANSEPPSGANPAFSYGSLSTWTKEGGAALLAATPWSTIPEFEVGVPYNPDGGVPGVSWIARGGVPKDGYTDAPHKTQVVNIDGSGTPPTFEFTGGYDWAVNWNPDALGTVQPPGTVFTTWTGILTVPTPASLVRQGRQHITFTTTDQQLPTGSVHTINGNAAISVGPDKVIYTESTTSYTGTYGGSGLNDYQMDVRVIEPLSAGASFRALTSGDLSATTTIPTTTTVSSLSTLLSQIDILRVTVNPVGWWDDKMGLNPNGGRPGQHADQNNYYTYGNPVWASGTSPQANNASTTAVELPAAPSVSHLPTAGRYNNGGRLYAYQGSNKFGIFIIRNDATITVPVAFDTSSGFAAFGDGIADTWGSGKQSITQTVQLAISPDGRFGAVKIKPGNTGANDIYYTANSTRIVLFSLTGETAPLGGAQYKVITTGSSGGSTTGGTYMYANSLAMTNSYLYYICGNYTSTYASWKEHLIYRYQITGGAASGSLLTPAVANANWVNTTGAITSMMQPPFQKFDTPIQFGTTVTFNPTNFNVSYSQPMEDMYARDGWNSFEGGQAPMPFRVSKDGTTMVVVAGIEANSTSSTSVMNHDVWVDVNGGGVRRLSTIQRHSPHGGGRGYSLAIGPNSYFHWGRYTGPTTALEISDDATKVAIVVNRQNTAVSATSTTNWYNFRDDIVAWTTTNAWVSNTEIQVTGTETAATALFGGTHLWKFGALCFTRDNLGLVFWGGRSAQNNGPSTTTDVSRAFSGTFYSYEFSTGTLKSIVPNSDGGNSDGLFTYSTASVVNPTFSTTSNTMGHIRPYGGFLSKSGNFLYIVSLKCLSASDQTSNDLVAVNVRSLNNAASINGKVDGRGYKVLSQPSRRGFIPLYYYTLYYGLEYPYYAPGGYGGMSMHVTAKQTGYVYYASHYQANGPTTSNSSTTSAFYDGQDTASYWGDYGAYGGHVEGFAADLGGPVQRITLATLGSDTAGRTIHYLDTTDSGNAVAMIYDTAGPGNHIYSSEALVYLQNIGFDGSTGALNTTVKQFIVDQGGRVSDSIAHDSTGTKLYYAFGAGDENAKNVKEVTYSISAGTISTRTFAGTKRYVILFSGR